MIPYQPNIEISIEGALKNALNFDRISIGINSVYGWDHLPHLLPNEVKGMD
jgi:hypothetical protein